MLRFPENKRHIYPILLSAQDLLIMGFLSGISFDIGG
jgi:hypothetical protein